MRRTEEINLKINNFQFNLFGSLGFPWVLITTSRLSRRNESHQGRSGTRSRYTKFQQEFDGDIPAVGGTELKMKYKKRVAVAIHSNIVRNGMLENKNYIN